MLPIFFLAFASICQLPTTSGGNILDYYDAESELYIIQEWYEMVSNPLDETASMVQLENEARNVIDKPGSRMYDYLQRAMNFNKYVSDLTRAECLVVTMFTDDSSDSAFYKEYNEASKNRIWQPYRVYTTLLMSAMEKLAMIDPIPANAILYRGIDFKPEPPRYSRIFWESFLSTSLNISIAEEFAGRSGMILEFQPPHSRFAAQVRELSFNPREAEVILLPFEVFDYLYDERQRFYFKTSENQELLQESEYYLNVEL